MCVGRRSGEHYIIFIPFLTRKNNVVVVAALRPSEARTHTCIWVCHFGYMYTRVCVSRHYGGRKCVSTNTLRRRCLSRNFPLLEADLGLSLSLSLFLPNPQNIFTAAYTSLLCVYHECALQTRELYPD